MFSSDIDECDSNPCAEGSTCLNLFNAYNCLCAAGFTGQTCSQSKALYLLYNMCNIADTYVCLEKNARCYHRILKQLVICILTFSMLTIIFNTNKCAEIYHTILHSSTRGVFIALVRAHEVEVAHIAFRDSAVR